MSHVPEVTPGAEEAAGGRAAHDRATVYPKEVQASELAELSLASRGLVHRVRVLTKRLNSLCAMHPRLMWELEEGKRLLLPGSGIVNPPSFPDPYELGTLEVTVTKRVETAVPLPRLVGLFLSR